MTLSNLTYVTYGKLISIFPLRTIIFFSFWGEVEEWLWLFFHRFKAPRD